MDDQKDVAHILGCFFKDYFCGKPKFSGAKDSVNMRLTLSNNQSLRHIKM